MSIWCVVLAGGVGSRFWPLSTAEQPKQLLPLVTEQSMLEDSLDRLAPLAPPERTLILTNATLQSRVQALAPRVPSGNVISEPKPAGTCAALAWAAHEILKRAGRDAVMICVHADWSVANSSAFRASLAHAAELARERRALVTVGIVPTRPDPGFGYIHPGAQVEDGAFRVERFVEKPDRARAQEMVEKGFLWNSGIFAWCVGDLLDEIDALTPEVGPALKAHGDDLAGFFSAVKPIAIDVGVLERSAKVLVIPGDFGWDDVGTWAALHRVRNHDEHNNAVQGRAHIANSTGNVVHSDNGVVVLYGVHDLVVVSRDGVTMVTTREHAADLKVLLDSLPSELRGT